MFSVVIPLYNKEKSIGNTIQSVLNQTFQDFEIVVVNDGSTDNSLQVVENINDSRIRIINKPNGGVSSARNTGIREARYEWIAFLDGDDLWEKDHLEEILNMQQLFPKEKFFATSYEQSDGRFLFKHKRSSEIFIIENYFRDAMNENIVCSSNVVLNRFCFENVGFFNVKLNRGEDLDMWARLARVYSVVKSHKVTAVYRVHSENRAVKSPLNFNNSILSIINLKDNTSTYEKRYKKKLIIDGLKILIVSFNLVDCMKTIFKYNIRLLV